MDKNSGSLWFYLLLSFISSFIASIDAMAKKEIKRWVETHSRSWKYHADPVSWFGLMSFFGIW